ncbi:MAG: DUF1223 domain-containing protein [Terriglobales bacterium]
MAMSRSISPLSSVLGTLFLCVLFLQTVSAANGIAQQVDDKSATPSTAGAESQPVLVELFTSEGCSSCPPADALLEKMDTMQLTQGAQLIVLSEHVDYWDHDGWKDPNSSAALTERQSSYEAVLGEKTAFTPQFVVDGSNELRQGGPQRMEDTIKKAAAIPKIPIRIDGTNVDAGNLRVHIGTDVNSDKHNADVFVAIALDRVESQVLRGENTGRHLVHVAVVQQITKVGKLPKGKTFDQQVQLKLKSGEDSKNLRIVAFIQEPGPGKVLGAALWKPVH